MVRTFVVALFAAALIPFPAPADPNVEIYFYSINKKQQQRELSIIFNRDEPGCHNMPGALPTSIAWPR